MVRHIVPVFLAILLALTQAPSVMTEGFDVCDLKDEGQHCWLADRTKYGDGVNIVYADNSDASCPGLRRQKSKRILEECKTDKTDYCYWMKDPKASKVDEHVAGCICKAFLDKHGVSFKEGCVNISAQPFEGRGEVCLCQGSTKGDGDRTGCNVKGLGEIDPPQDGCGFGGNGRSLISQEALFLSLITAIFFLI